MSRIEMAFIAAATALAVFAPPAHADQDSDFLGCLSNHPGFRDDVSFAFDVPEASAMRNNTMSFSEGAVLNLSGGIGGPDPNDVNVVRGGGDVMIKKPIVGGAAVAAVAGGLALVPGIVSPLMPPSRQARKPSTTRGFNQRRLLS